jgi:tRNA uridine 5-carbamoylmethylation protein Kti12
MLIVLCGPAGAGKTSIARRLAGKLEGAPIISSDRFRRRAYDRVMKEVESGLEENEYMIVDATFYRRRWRERLMEAVGDRQRVVTVFVDCSLETCLRRNSGRDVPIPDEAVCIIWSEFERPVDHDIYINTEESSVEQAVDKILRELKVK